MNKVRLMIDFCSWANGAYRMDSGQRLQNLLGENIGRGWHVNCLSPKELRCAQGLGGDCFDCKKQKPVRTSLRGKRVGGTKVGFQDAGVPVGHRAVGPFKGLEGGDGKPSENPVVGLFLCPLSLPLCSSSRLHSFSLWDWFFFPIFLSIYSILLPNNLPVIFFQLQPQRMHWLNWIPIPYS